MGDVVENRVLDRYPRSQGSVKIKEQKEETDLWLFLVTVPSVYIIDKRVSVIRLYLCFKH